MYLLTNLPFLPVFQNVTCPTTSFTDLAEIVSRIEPVKAPVADGERGQGGWEGGQLCPPRAQGALPAMGTIPCSPQSPRVPLLPPPLGQRDQWGCPDHGEAPAVSLLLVCSQVRTIPAQVSSGGSNISGNSASIPWGCPVSFCWLHPWPVLGWEEAELKLCPKDVFLAVVSRIRSDSLAPLLLVCSCCWSSSEVMRSRYQLLHGETKLLCAL